MRQDRNPSAPSAAIARYFNQASLPSQQETLGQLVVEILRDNRTLNRKSLCNKLISRLQQAQSAQEELHYQELIGLLFIS
ncbi:regulatory protein YcgZ [Candidatus Pantoea soli]|uniref:Two-component-system connector protein YcgZ n=1 Tax=Candidatus Pantoea soli TaxID=3098669 RepID=A0A518XIJ8_9GAMM|nr:regulatory protein YcgZ [Pantoea soli]QDY44021.1 two-component-system connector protein YcgZ [Pantoea soli]